MFRASRSRSSARASSDFRFLGQRVSLGAKVRGFSTEHLAAGHGAGLVARRLGDGAHRAEPGVPADAVAVVLALGSADFLRSSF
jgi:hypothetical protein